MSPQRPVSSLQPGTAEALDHRTRLDYRGMMIDPGGRPQARSPAQRVLRRSSAPVHGTLFIPPRPAAGAVVIGGSGGSEPAYVAEALAAEGLAALSVAYFARPGLPDTLSGINLEYFGSALELLRSELPPGVPVAIIGMSRGSEAALLAAIHLQPPVAGVVATVPGNVVAGGIPDGPAWLLDGRSLPWTDHTGPACDNPAAVIPVERVPGRILLVAAGADTVWPSAAMARAISHRLRRHGDHHGHVLLEYPDASHSLGYLIPTLPLGLLPGGLDDDKATGTARAQAWAGVLEFLRHLP